MKVVILAGGFGSRISEESYLRPKPMVEVGGQPILWHIMKFYSAFGFNDFVICAGYKQHAIKEYFADYYLRASDVTFDYTGDGESLEIHDTHAEPWRVTVADTGLHTQTGGRIRRIKKYVDGERFMLTYGDGLSDVDLNKLLEFHDRAGGVVTLTGVNVSQRFGVLDMDHDGHIKAFREKSDVDDSAINGGFMVFEPEIFNERLGDGDDFSKVALEDLAAKGELTVYRHTGYWKCMDTQRDREILDETWSTGNAPWKVW